MASEEMDLWGTDASSGFCNSYVGIIEDAHFGTDPRYNQGISALMFWDVKVLEVADEESHSDRVGETQEERFSLGTGWASEDGGKTVAHASGKPNKKFHVTSQYGKVIALITKEASDYGDAAEYPEEPPAIDFDGLGDLMRSKGLPPMNAEVWVGLKFRFAEIAFDFGEDRKEPGKRIKSGPKAWPVEFLGEGADEAPKKKTAAAKAAAAKAKKAAKPTFESLTGDLEGVVDEEVLVGVKEALINAEDFDGFSEAAIEVEGAVANDDLMVLIVNEDEGLWATKQ